MTNEQAQVEEAHKDFFISYTSQDRAWAQWIAWQLEAQGYTVVLQAWDFHPGDNFVRLMDEAIKTTKRTLAVLSADYLNPKAAYSYQEVLTILVQDLTGQWGKLLPVRVRECAPGGLLTGIIYVDLVDLDATTAKETLLAGVQQSRHQPASEPLFPGKTPPVRSPVPGFPGLLPPTWNIPYPQNPLFTGREELLTQLATTLRAGQRAALSQPQAITSLGGIGKTQIALEYAYRHRQDYQAVLWAQADTRENLTASYLVMATLLNLPEKNEQESARVLTAVRKWFQRTTGWLLILDNADELALAREFLPPSFGGQVLLTTRTQATGRFAHRLEVDTLPMESGALFLLRRAGLLTPDATLEQVAEGDRDQARIISQELGGLPLALDQVGAYIEETRCSISDYQQRYRTRRARLLQRRGSLVAGHPAAVATTWSLAFEQVKQVNPAAADLLWVCAFLAPDAIPEEIITKGAAHLGPVLEPAVSDPIDLDETIATLGAYSLVRRHTAEKTFSMHRLVQAVFKDQMDEQDRHQWDERAVRAVNAALPSVEHKHWSQWERILPHALICAELIAQEPMTFPEATRLLNQTGFYLHERARYVEAEPLLKQALTIDEQVYGPDHVEVATDLNNLAGLYESQGQYEQAEPLFQRALEIFEQQLGPDHPSTATSLNNLAELYQAQGKHEQTRPLYQRALSIKEQQLVPTHPDTASSLNNLAELYQAQGKYELAEPLYQRALAIREQQLGSTHPDTASSLNNLALLYRVQGQYAQAEPLYQRALVICEQQLGPTHPDTASSLNNLAALYWNQGKHEQAEPLLERALAIWEQQLGPDHLNTATSLNNLAELYRAQGQYAQAEPLYQRALAICEQQLGPTHLDTASSLNNLAELYRAQGKYEQAEPLLKQALTICEQQLGPTHPDTTQGLNNLAGLYHDQGNYEQAEPLYQRALTIREQQLGPQHPDTAQSVWWLAVLSEQQQQYEKAASLYQRALSIDERALGPQHPTTQTIRANYAYLLRTMGHDTEAAALNQP